MNSAELQGEIASASLALKTSYMSAKEYEKAVERGEIADVDAITDDLEIAKAYPDHPLAYKNRMERIAAVDFYNQLASTLRGLKSDELALVIDAASDCSPAVRLAAVQAIAQAGGPSTDDAVAEVLRVEEDIVRRKSNWVIDACRDALKFLPEPQPMNFDTTFLPNRKYGKWNLPSKGAESSDEATGSKYSSFFDYRPSHLPDGVGEKLDRMMDFLKAWEDDNDWTFVIKCHSLIEATTSQLISARLSGDDILPVVERLSLSDPTTGKIAFGKSMGAMSNGLISKIIWLSELRNKLVHNLDNVEFSLKDYYAGLDKNQRKSTKKKLLADIIEDTESNVEVDQDEASLRYQITLAVWHIAFQTVISANTEPQFKSPD